jgi:putative cell wall-binding protein
MMMSRPRATLLMSTALIGLAISGGFAAGPAAAAPAPPPKPSCPPVTAHLGVQYLDVPAYDSDAGSYPVSVSAGSLPPGVSLFDGGWYTEFRGAPQTAGAYDFTLSVIDENTRLSSHQSCRVSVKADVSLDPTITVGRIAAADRFAESVAISQASVTGTSKLVYLASGEVFADALSAGSVAAQRSAPLLLTAKAGIPPAVVSELNRLEPDDVVVLGGDATISGSVLDQLGALAKVPTVTRITGADRYEMSRNLISHATFGPTVKPAGVFLASGRTFPDALSAAPAAAKYNAAVLLVDGTQSSLSDAEKNLLRSGIRPRFVPVMGGSDTVSDALMSSIDDDGSTVVSRVHGADRYLVSSHTAAAYFLSSIPPKTDTVYLTTGANYPDALAGTPLAAKTGSPILLITRDCIPADAAHRISLLGAKRIVLLGGTDSIAHSVEKLVVCAP